MNKLNWFFDHAETISDQSIERVKKLGGGIAIQNRMAFQGEYFVDQYGKQQGLRTPPIKKILDAGIPIGMGTDATRVSSYNPWLCLYWLTTGKTIGGMQLYNDSNILSREKALELYTMGSAWFSQEQDRKGSFIEGQLADFAVLSKDYFHVIDNDIKEIYSLMTVVGGQIVYAADDFSVYNPPLPEISPAWSPIKYSGTYDGNKVIINQRKLIANSCLGAHHKNKPDKNGFDCLCWAF